MPAFSFRPDIGIDLGTASVLVYVKGRGIVLSEPSVVAIDSDTGEILEVGKRAQAMLGRTPKNIQAIRPLRDGVISQYDITLKMLQYFIKASCGAVIGKPRVVVCIPSGITEVEERAVVDAAKNAGAGAAYLIEEPVAAAIGAGIDISAPSGNMIVDIGGGTTDIAVISLDGVVVSESIKTAGDKFDEAIARYVRKKYNVYIGDVTAEKVKRAIGTVFTQKKVDHMDVKGRCLSTGLPKMVSLSSVEMLEALVTPIMSIVEAICQVLERTPPELVADIINNGIVLTGGGAQLKGFDQLITYMTNIKTRVAKDPVNCVVLGTGRSLDDISSFKEGIINLARIRQQRS